MCVSAVEFGSFKYFDFFLLSRPPPCSPLFPYTTLFRSLCGRFTARVIRNVKIQPSPKWLKDRLEASGVASISNVVDISNYVMLELGHPLHTFDYDKVRDHKIVVRRANPGDAAGKAALEKMRTLDGIERKFYSNICMNND